MIIVGYYLPKTPSFDTDVTLPEISSNSEVWLSCSIPPIYPQALTPRGDSNIRHRPVKTGHGMTRVTE